jgi:hypothetical protein
MMDHTNSIECGPRMTVTCVITARVLLRSTRELDALICGSLGRMVSLQLLV